MRTFSVGCHIQALDDNFTDEALIDARDEADAEYLIWSDWKYLHPEATVRVTFCEEILTGEDYQDSLLDIPFFLNAAIEDAGLSWGDVESDCDSKAAPVLLASDETESLDDIPF